MQVISNISSKFSPQDISGQLLYLNSESTEVHNSSNKVRMLQEKTIIQDASTETAGEKHAHLIKIWFIVGFAFAVFYAVMAMVYMDFKNDSLLYAKFLTVDSR